jgi:hypothetical protein
MEGPDRRCGGQAVVETALVAPTVIFFILGIIQLGLLQQARLMLEYAAFTAARAGAVWNADDGLMEDAAVFALTPTFGVGATTSGVAPSLQPLSKTYTAFQKANRLKAPMKLVRIDVLNPTQESLGERKEADFDEPSDRQNTQLTIRVTYFFSLKIPYANCVIWQSAMAANAGIAFVRRVDGWYREAPGQPMGSGGVLTNRRDRLTSAGANVKIANACYSHLQSQDMSTMTSLALANGTYLLPLVTTYTIRMQSNPVRDRLPLRADVLSGC